MRLTGESDGGWFPDVGMLVLATVTENWNMSCQNNQKGCEALMSEGSGTWQARQTELREHRYREQSRAKRAKFGGPIIACSENMSAAVLGCTHKLVTDVPSLSSCKYWCQNVNQGSSSSLVCLLNYRISKTCMTGVKQICLQMLGSLFTID